MLYRHEKHPHQPVNVNLLHRAEQAEAAINQKIAVSLTRVVGTMWAAYTFAGLALVGLLAILGVFSPTVALLVAWTSQTLIQLCMLPIIMVGQAVLSRKQELQSDEMFQTTQKNYHDSEQLILHLGEQDKELLKQTAELLKQTPILEELLEIARHPPVAALTSAIDYEPTVQPKSAADKRGRAKA